jgi:hypothetical protein
MDQIILLNYRYNNPFNTTIMTKREGAVLTAYTGLLLGSFEALQVYAEEKLGRPIFTHEFASEAVRIELKAKSEVDFKRIMESQTP